MLAMFILERTSSESHQELKTLSSFVQPLVPCRVAKDKEQELSPVLARLESRRDRK